MMAYVHLNLKSTALILIMSYTVKGHFLEKSKKDLKHGRDIQWLPMW